MFYEVFAHGSLSTEHFSQTFLMEKNSQITSKLLSLGGSGGTLGGSWEVLGRLGERFGRPKRILDASWVHLDGVGWRSGSIFGRLGGILAPSWGYLGTFWGVLGVAWRRHGSILGAFLGVLERLVHETLFFACFFQVVLKFSALFNVVNH